MPRPRSVTRLVLITLFLGLVGAGLTSAPPARALLGVGDVTSTIADIPRTIFQIVDKVRLKLQAAFKISGDIAFKSSIQIFQNRLLQEVQTQLATTGPGQKPLFLTNPKSFFKNVSNAAAGQFIDDFSRSVTGQTGPGTSFSGARGQFLITRLLRAQVGGQLSGQCKQDCTASFSADTLDTSPIIGMTASEIQAYSQTSFRNGHEWEIFKVTYDIDGRDGTQSLVDKNTKTTPYDCPDISQPAGAAPPGSTMPYVINLGGSIQFAGTTAINDCLQAQKEAILNERSVSQTEVNQCFLECQNGVTGTGEKAITTLTATDIFTAYKTLNAQQAPAALANSLSESKSDLGQFLNAAGTLTAKVQEVVVGEQTNLNPNNLPVTTRVSEEVKTPSSAASALFGIPFVSDNGQFTYTGTSVADILKGIASFINSPVGRALASYFNSRCGLNPDACKGPSGARSTIGQLVFGPGSPTGLAGAQLLYATLGRTDIISGDPGRNEIGVTDQLMSSGLIDSGFRQAIEETLTVQEAVQRHLLDPQKTFGFDKTGVEPRNGYPFRALQYLRKYRVTPVGWELAAKYSQLFDHRDLSLGFLLNRFETCGQDVTHKVCSRGPKADQACQINTDCGVDTNGAEIFCGASPYCGLVDPKWVLKAPQTFCRRLGAGEEVIAKEFVCDQNNVDRLTGQTITAATQCLDFASDVDNTTTCHDVGAPDCMKSDANPYPDFGRWVIERNSDTCADTQSCIAENDDGSCLAYGYCVQERQQFKFDGTQCAAENSSCTTYTNALGLPVSYLANTVDTRNCTAENAGCTEYCAARTASGALNYDPKTQLCADLSLDINFTGKVQLCDASQAGCHEFLQTTGGSNLLRNGGFEVWEPAVAKIDQDAATFSGWTIPASGIATAPVSASDGAYTTNNRAAAKLTGISGLSPALFQVVNTGSALFERSFTFSVRAKSGTGVSCQAGLFLGTNNGDPDRPKVLNTTDVGTDWNTFSVTINLPSEGSGGTLPATMTELQAQVQTIGCSTLYLDSAKLEEGTLATRFTEYGDANPIYLNQNRSVCTSADVGCETYTPLAGGPAIFGQVRNSNRCAADMVGCASYTLEPTTTVPTRTGGQVNIVPPRATQCTAADVGCEEYTNLDVVAQGGEGKEYYKSVRQCVRPADTGASNPIQATYYTWVGDASLGFVLRAYDLVKSQLAGNTNAPCTSLSIGTITAKAVCNDDATTLANAQVSCASAADLTKNADCAQYYDQALNVYYRNRSHTVSVTDNCHPYRNTIDQTIGGAAANNVYYLSTAENVSCSAAAAGCRAYTGNAAGTTRQVFSDQFESTGVTNWLGGELSNASVTINGHSMKILQSGPSSAAVTKTSVLKNQLVAGRTYLVSFTAAATASTATPIRVALGHVSGSSFNPDLGTFNTTPVQATWNTAITPPGPEWNTFTVGPLTIAPGANVTDASLAFSGSVAYIDNVVLTEVNDHVYLISSTVPACTNADLGCAAYSDRRSATQYLKSFTRLCSEQVVGCEALIDTQNSSTPFAQTIKGITTPADTVVTVVNSPANYCLAAAKGCDAYGSTSFTTDHNFLGFQTKYLINDPDRHAIDLCLDSEISCQAYTLSNGTSTYFKDPTNRTCEYRTGGDNGGQWTITGTSFSCPTVTPPLAGRPIGASCGPSCVGGVRDGRPCGQVGSSADCPAGVCQGGLATAGMVKDSTGKPVLGQCTDNSSCFGACVDGERTGQTCTANGDCTDSLGGSHDCGLNTCQYLVGTCPAEESGCTEYRDPTDPINCRSDCPLSLSQGGSPDFVDAQCTRTTCQGGIRAGQNCQTSFDCFDGQSRECVGVDGQSAQGLPGCRSYYYLRQSLETNASACNGRIDLTTGCRPFNDTTKSGLDFRGL